MKYDPIIESASKQYRIDSALIKAVISVESSWNPAAKRYEPHIKDTSYGLMQVLVKTAKWVMNNPKVTPGQLADPTLNILVGTRYLAYLKKKYPKMDDTIAAYNAGRPIMSKKDPKKYVNQHYVNKVRRAYSGYKKGGMGLGLIAASVIAITVIGVK